MADILILIPARMASTRLPGKPLAEIAGEPMIVHVLRRAQAAGIGPVVVATDSAEIAAAVDKSGGRAVMTRADHLSGSDRIFEALGKVDPRRRRQDRRQRAGRPADAQARRYRRLAHAARRRRRGYRDACRRDHQGRRAHQSQRGQGRRHAGRPGAAARALFYPRHGARPATGRSITISGFMRIRRAALERFVKLPPSTLEQREKLEQLRALEAGMRIDVAIVDTVPLGVDTPEDLETARAMLERTDDGRQRTDERRQLAAFLLSVVCRPSSVVSVKIMSKRKKNLLPGRAGRQFAHRLQRGLSRLRAAAVSDLRGCLRRGAHRPRRARHDPDRQFGGRPRRRHPSPDAGVRPAHRRRMVPAGAASIDGAARRDAAKRSRRSRATSTRSASAATSSARSASRRWSPPTPRAPRAKWPKPAMSRARPWRRSWRRKSTACKSSRRTSPTPSTTPPASWCWRRSRNGRAARKSAW